MPDLPYVTVTRWVFRRVDYIYDSNQDSIAVISYNDYGMKQESSFLSKPSCILTTIHLGY
jgi:hypothetical protein